MTARKPLQLCIIIFGLLSGSSAIAGMSSAIIRHCTPAIPGKPSVCVVRNLAVDVNQNVRWHM
jgi:hypothetical protein